jgi:hypothetical protein
MFVIDFSKDWSVQRQTFLGIDWSISFENIEQYRKKLVGGGSPTKGEPIQNSIYYFLYQKSRDALMSKFQRATNDFFYYFSK